MVWSVLSAAIGCAALAGALVYRGSIPKPAGLKVDSYPPGASVFLNDEFRGTTPLQLSNLREGKHVLRLTLFRHRSWQQEVEVREGTNTVSAELAARQGGRLTVKSDPPGASLYIDGTPKGATPVSVTDLDPGSHAVRLVKPDYMEWESAQAVVADKTTIVEAKMMLRMENFLIKTAQVQPDMLSNWSEMFHFYVVTHEYAKASNALASGLNALIREPVKNDPYKRRLQGILTNMWTGKGEVNYGTDADIRRGKDSIEQGYEQALKIHPDSAETYGMLVFFYAEDENIEKGNAVLEKGLAQFPYDRAWYMTTLPGRERAGSLNIGECRRRLKAHPEDLVARMRQVTLLERDSSLDEAIAEYPRLIERMKSSAVRFSLQQSLGSLYERRRRIDEALAAYEKALQEEGTPQYQAQVLYRIVRIKRDADDVDGVVSNWVKAISIQPEPEYACRWRLQLAQYCVEHERQGKARELCQEILKLSSADSVRKEAFKLIESLDKEKAEEPK